VNSSKISSYLNEIIANEMLSEIRC